MTKEAIIAEIQKLSPEDQREVMAVVDDKGAAQDWGITEEQKTEILRRLREYQRDPAASGAMSAEDFEQELDREFQ